jgi:hypothetical protein
MFATTNVVSMVLVVDREYEGQVYPVQRPAYYVSEVLADTKNTLFTASEVALRTPDHIKKAVALLPSPQDQGALILPLGEIICNCNANGRIIKWSVELGEFDIEFYPQQVIKSQILADFMSEWTEIYMPPPEERP